MADEVVPIETRKVVIEFEVRVPTSPGLAPHPQPVIPRAQVTPEMVEEVRRELLKTGRRNADIFGGLA